MKMPDRRERSDLLLFVTGNEKFYAEEKTCVKKFGSEAKA